MTFLSIVVYVAFQIVWLPLSLLGVIWVGYKQIAVSKRLGVSQTAIEIINGRWTMDVFGLRKDRGARRLARALPNTSTWGLMLALFPLYVLQRMSGKHLLYPRLPEPGKEGVADLVMARTTYIDEITKAHDDATQFVVLGAGFDTRAYDDEAARRMKFFELDQQKTQALKRKCLKRARLSTKAVSFVEVDFAKEDWKEALLVAGFDPKQKSIFLWEGVTLYLDADDIRATLDAVRSIGSPGSALIVDFYAARFVKMAAKGVAKKTLEATGEMTNFGLEFGKEPEASLRQFLRTQGLTLSGSHFLGASSRKGPYAVVAEVLL